MLTIVRRRFYNWLRDARRQRTDALAVTGDDDGFWDMADPDGLSPEAHLLSKNRGVMMQRLIDTLSPALREVIILCELEDMSYREIAEVTADLRALEALLKADSKPSAP